MSTVIGIISFVLQAYEFLIFIRVILSWIQATSYQSWFHHPLVRILYQITDPILVPLQRIIPPIGAGPARIDISPIVALILLEILRAILIFVLRAIF